MARVAAFVPDLLFGSRVRELLGQAGHDTTLCATRDDVRAASADVLLVDLTAEVDERLGLADTATPTLAVYAHVEADVRARAHDAGFDLVVPRSRLMREGGELVEQLARPGRQSRGT